MRPDYLGKHLLLHTEGSAAKHGSDARMDAKPFLWYLCLEH